ncbi:hypothetical protein C2G38_2253582 [Gigaspora rosea]|uniref:Uncharacterized protein n=1 Tax=Gigaspora rosea TaxID=44941 RepID=A0A397U6H7_9GLOM|nr:hypothetical protein C2G38_2253582 [Gigaspora rosea]
MGSKKKGELLLEYIKESNDGNIECIELWDMDLADLHSVKNFADKFIKEVGELHYLWNNSGGYLVKTKDNFEQQFQNVVYGNELNRRLKNSRPISTNMGPNNILKKVIMMFAKSPDNGAINAMYPSLDPNIDEGGKYFEDYKEVKPNDQVLDEELAKMFWGKSEELLNNYDSNLLK